MQDTWTLVLIREIFVLSKTTNISIQPEADRMG